MEDGDVEEDNYITFDNQTLSSISSSTKDVEEQGGEKTTVVTNEQMDKDKNEDDWERLDGRLVRVNAATVYEENEENNSQLKFETVMTRPDADKRYEAMKKEYNTLVDMDIGSKTKR